MIGKIKIWVKDFSNKITLEKKKFSEIVSVCIEWRKKLLEFSANLISFSQNPAFHYINRHTTLSTSSNPHRAISSGTRIPFSLK